MQEVGGPIAQGFPAESPYSPTTCTMMFLFLDLLSSSTNTICCHVPRVSFPSEKGTVREGPIMAALTWEWPFPSCHLR